MAKVFRGGRFVVHVAVVIGLVGVVLTRPAEAQTADAYQAIALVNATRASVGAPPLAHDAALSAVAQSWAGTIAPSGALRHNPNLGTQARGWTAMAENVGMGPGVEAVHRQLVTSPNHYANMTDRRFTRAGAGVVASGGRVYVVQVFMNGPVASPAAPSPSPAPAPTAPPTTPPAPPPPPTTQPTLPPPPPPPPIATPTPAPTAPAEPSRWLAVGVERLQAALDRAFGVNR